MDLVERMISGDERALARLISLAENDAEELPDLISRLFPYTGRGYCIGVTGPPGAGKSTIVDKLTQWIRQRGETVGILAVDPTSPFTGGAVLGDRIRMQQHYLDKGVFIRSMASRGSQGGLAKAARNAIKLLDASGKDFIIVETVGVGQTELDIMRVADTVMVVLVPEAGDAIQTMKAGLMEIADIFVVNKADREGADAIRNDLITMLHLSPRYDWWDVPVMTTEAKDNVGIPELFGKIEKHRNVLIETGHLERRRQARRERAFTEVLYEKLKRAVEKRMADDQRYPSLKEEVISGKIDPYRAADDVLKSLFGD